MIDLKYRYDYFVYIILPALMFPSVMDPSPSNHLYRRGLQHLGNFGMHTYEKLRAINLEDLLRWKVYK